MGYLFFVGCPGCQPASAGVSGGGGMPPTTPTSYTAANTGQDAGDGTDANWLLDGGVAYIVPDQGPWGNAQDGTHWISRAANAGSGAGGTQYTYSAKLTIPEDADPDAIRIKASVMADNQIVDVIINGASTGISIPGNHNFGSPTVLNLAMPGFWAVGENDVSFVVLDDGTITGFDLVWLE